MMFDNKCNEVKREIPRGASCDSTLKRPNLPGPALSFALRSCARMIIYVLFRTIFLNAGGSGDGRLVLFWACRRQLGLVRLFRQCDFGVDETAEDADVQPHEIYPREDVVTTD